MTDMNDETRYVRRDVLNTTVDEDLILFDEQAGTYYATSAVGTAIWEHLAEPLTFAELCDRLAAEYEVAREACETDTGVFLQQLLDANVVMRD